MIHIVGRNEIPQFKVFDMVKDAIEHRFDEDVYLGAFIANTLGVALKGKKIYNMEYLHDDSPLWGMGYKEILENNEIIDFSRGNIAYLAKLGLKADYYPFPIDKSMVKVRQDLDKNIDVLFIGSTHFERRQHILDKLGKNCNLIVAEGVYGAELDDLIGRSKLHLNIHHADGQPLETVRINYLIANNCIVVSEKGSDNQLNNEYEDKLIFAEYSDIVDVCLSTLNNINLV